MDAYAEYLFGPVKFQAHDTVHCAEITVDVVTEIKVKKVTHSSNFLFFCENKGQFY